jgi:hypothetical protein
VDDQVEMNSSRCAGIDLSLTWLALGVTALHVAATTSQRCHVSRRELCVTQGAGVDALETVQLGYLEVALVVWLGWGVGHVAGVVRLVQASVGSGRG